MRWTKKHSTNAVRAKRRLAIERANAGPAIEPIGKAYKPVKFVPDFTINIRCKSGDRLQITATRWGKQFITGDGVKSARAISRGIETLLRHCAP